MRWPSSSHIQWRNSSTDPKHTRKRNSSHQTNEPTNERTTLLKDPILYSISIIHQLAQHSTTRLHSSLITFPPSVLCVSVWRLPLPFYTVMYTSSRSTQKFMCECCALFVLLLVLCVPKEARIILGVLWIIWSKNNTDYSLCCYLLLLFDVIVVFVVSVFIFSPRILGSHCDFKICVSVESYVIVLLVASFFFQAADGKQNEVAFTLANWCVCAWNGQIDI